MTLRVNSLTFGLSMSTLAPIGTCPPAKVAPCAAQTAHMKMDDLLSEARAKIIWGEPSASVRDFMTSNGFSDKDAEVKIKEFTTERNNEIRRIGVKKILIGAALTAGAGGLLYLEFRGGSVRHGYQVRNYSPKGNGVLAFICLYGIWKLTDGIIYLVRPKTEERSVTEISE